MARQRRPAEETRAEILGIAQRSLVEHGPAGVRLDEIAKEVGVSRQAILHHFGSREELMRAVVEQAWTGLFRDLATLAAVTDKSPDAFVDHVDDVVRRKGNARLGGWLLLSGKGLPDAVFEGALAGLPDAVFDDADDAGLSMLLVGAALFGDALFGKRLRQVLGMADDEASREAFRAFLADRAWAKGGSPAR
ncbi:MAG: TetR/AcrR family transcriptional regulator [Myxococcota bacterium]